MILILIVVLFILLLWIGGDRGVDIVWTLLGNFIIFVFTVYMLAKGNDIYLVTIISCLFVCCTTLFFQNGNNIKTLSAFISVMLVVCMFILLIYYIATRSAIQGFGIEYIDINESYGYSGNINLNMIDLTVSVIIIALIGAILDTSLAVSSATYEVYYNNKDIKFPSLFKSSMNIGKDILGTTVNTLFFIFAGESLTLMILLKESYSFSAMINSKIFCEEMIEILFSMAACIVVIPATALISSYMILNCDSYEDER